MNIKRYNEFMNEELRSPRGANIDSEVESKYKGSIVELLKSEAPWYLENVEKIQPIYRGLGKFRYEQSAGNKYVDVVRISPSEHKRRAANTKNYYIELMDNSPYWEGYPKRSKSIICSTDYGYSNDYGEVFRVIPVKENSTFAVCSDGDVFHSFPYLSNILKKITKGNSSFSVASFNTWLHIFGLGQDDDYETIKEKINVNGKKLANGDNTFETVYKTYSVNSYQESFMKLSNEFFADDDFVAEIHRWMRPDNNNFKKIAYNRNTKHSEDTNLKELWTDSECILIDDMRFLREIEDYINWG